MTLSGKKEYTVLVFSSERVSVCRFRAVRKKYRVAAFASSQVRDSDAAGTLRTLLRSTGGAQGVVLVCGNLAGGGFFRCGALPVEGIREQKSALEFELPRRMPVPPPDPVIQFALAQTEGEAEAPDWNVYAFPKTALLSLPAFLSPCRGRADEFIYPPLGMLAGDPAIRFPVLEPEFVFEEGEWRSPGENAELSPFWTEEFAKYFLFPEEFHPEEYTEALIVLRFLASGRERAAEKLIRVLPSKLRTKRLRAQIVLTVVLLLVLGGIHCRDIGAERYMRFREYQTLRNERDNYRLKTARLKTALKKREKDNRELQRILSLRAGEPELLTRLLELSAALPSDVLVTSLRFSENSADLMIQSESQTANLPQALRNLPVWKIASMQQRTMNDSVTMTILKLTAGEESE